MGPARHRQVVAYIESLHATYRFRFVDLTNIATFHGASNQFIDGVHPNVVNTDRAIDYLVAHDRAAL